MKKSINLKKIIWTIFALINIILIIWIIGSWVEIAMNNLNSGYEYSNVNFFVKLLNYNGGM